MSEEIIGKIWFDIFLVVDAHLEIIGHLELFDIGQ